MDLSVNNSNNYYNYNNNGSNNYSSNNNNNNSNHRIKQHKSKATSPPGKHTNRYFLEDNNRYFKSNKYYGKYVNNNTNTNTNANLNNNSVNNGNNTSNSYYGYQTTGNSPNYNTNNPSYTKRNRYSTGYGNAVRSNGLKRNYSKLIDLNRGNNTTTMMKKTSVDYSQLPDVVLTKIYAHLSLDERLNVSMTCKNWRGVLFTTPCLWKDFNLVVYLLNRGMDLKSAHYKTNALLKYVSQLSVKYDPNDVKLFKSLVSLMANNETNMTRNLKSLTLQPMFNVSYFDFYNYDNYYYNDEMADDNDEDETPEDELHEPQENEQHLHTFNNLNRRVFTLVKNFILNAKCVEHLSLGCMGDLDREADNMIELLQCLNKKHLFNLRSLHISSVSNSSILAFKKAKMSNTGRALNSLQKYRPTLKTAKSSSEPSQTNARADGLYLSNYLCQFVNLTRLSIDYEHLSDEFLRSTVCLLSLKKLNLNVNSINSTLSAESASMRDESWSIATNRNKSLRVTVNFLVVEEAARKYTNVLSRLMPLEKMRMYFCKSLNPELLHFLSDNYSNTLSSLVVVDGITDPTLRYHNPLRHDADPDPLVLLCWKCRHLSELVLVGYEVLEINLIAIAKLRSNLKVFYVPMDCIIDLRYGHVNNDDFIEDEDGEDTIVDYGFCSDQVIDKICKILGRQNWHPLEKDELPMCVYDYETPYEEAFLDTIINDQLYTSQ